MHHKHHLCRLYCKKLAARVCLDLWRGRGLCLNSVTLGVVIGVSLLESVMSYSCSCAGFHEYTIVFYNKLVSRSISSSKTSLSSDYKEFSDVVLIAFEVSPMGYSSSDFQGVRVSSSIWMISNSSLVSSMLYEQVSQSRVYID